jgi:hypothetical protein
MTVFRETRTGTRARQAVAWTVAALLAAIPVVFLATVVVGAVRGYAPVPFWDMWDAYLGSYLQLHDGDWVSYLFSQTNEHRIPLSRILFWVDLRFFGGLSLVLVPVNIALLVALWGVLCAAAWPLFRDRKDLWAIACAGIAAPCLSWMQMRNVVWGFQSQWMLAYLVPLCAFASLALSAARPERHRWFAAAILCGVLSMGTMANGLLVMPLLVVMQLLLDPRRWRRAVVIAAVGAVFTAAWFHLYSGVDRGPMIARRLPGYILSFFGLPFYRGTRRLFDRWPAVPEDLAYVGGVAFIAAAASLAFWWLRTRKRQHPTVLALLAFLAYISGTTLIIAVGRVHESRLASVVDRYATLALLAWATLAVLAAFRFKGSPRARKAYAAVALAVAALMLPSQFTAFADDGPVFAHRETLAGLALVMHVDDVPSIKLVYPVDIQKSHALMAGYVAQAERRRLTIFGDPAWRDAVAQLGRPARGHPCHAAVDGIDPVEGDPRYRIARGWAYDDATRRTPRFVALASGGTVVGIAVTGFPRDDIAHGIPGAPADTGFDGYVIADAAPPLQVMCR